MFPKCTIKKIILVLPYLFPILLFQPDAMAATGPVDYVRSILNEVMTIQTNPSMEGVSHRVERKKAIGAIIVKNFDTARMAQNALGDSWKKLDRKQQAEFASVFRDLFQDSYTRMVLDFLKQEKVRYAPETSEGNKSLVKTAVMRPNENIPVDYLLEKTSAGWRVHDVTIDGVSIVGTYRNSFDRVIKGASFQALLNKLQLQQKAIRENS